MPFQVITEILKHITACRESLVTLPPISQGRMEELIARREAELAALMLEC